MRELLADISHEIWAHWMRYLISCCTVGEDGKLMIPVDKVLRWKRQINTPYPTLSEEEKQSDRQQADKILKVLSLAGNVDASKERVLSSLIAEMESYIQDPLDANCDRAELQVQIGALYRIIRRWQTEL